MSLRALVFAASFCLLSGADNRHVPVCVEASCLLRSGIRIDVRLGVADTGQRRLAIPAVFWCDVDDGRRPPGLHDPARSRGGVARGVGPGTEVSATPGVPGALSGE